ncbi:hypothetical protein V6N13_080000 [Hibiscus sabdariffa]
MESPFKAEILKGKVALVTGGGSGIGYGISLELGKHGASVAIMGRRKHVVDSAVDALRSHGIPAIGIEGDVRKEADAARTVESTFQHFGRLDILVNAAAGNFLAAAEDLSPNGFRTAPIVLGMRDLNCGCDWLRFQSYYGHCGLLLPLYSGHYCGSIPLFESLLGVLISSSQPKFTFIDIDTVGTFIMSHEALKYLKKGGPGKDPSIGGTIINITAVIHYPASWYQVHASAAKAAIDSMTRSLALEWGEDHGILVNGIAPGAIGDTAGLTKLAPREILNQVKRKPLYKFGEKWDVAMAALYLASDAGKFVNGTILVVDGGQWLSKPRLMSKEDVKKLSKREETRSRVAPAGLPKSKL